jgi:hypothetical protein
VTGDKSATISATKLVLDYHPDGAREGDWRIQDAGGKVTISVGEKWLKALLAGVEAISRGEGDYAIGGDPQLWFW